MRSVLMLLSQIHTIKEFVRESFVRISTEYTIRIYDDQQQSNNNSNNNNNNNIKKKKYLVQLMSQKATIVKSTILFSSNESTKPDDKVDASSKGACLLTSSGFYNLYTPVAGRYLVKLELLVPYLNNKNTGMELKIPQSSNNSVMFQVNQPNSNIKVFNSFPDVDATQEYLLKHEKESSSTSVVFVKLPTDTQLKIQWTAIEESLKTLEKNQTSTISIKPNMVIQQNTLCSLGEGLLQLKNHFIYKIIAGVISQFNIEIENNISIVNVEGKAIKKWDISTSGDKRTLKVDLDYGVENSYELKVFGEYSMGDTTGEVSVSPMICKGEEISRQRGFLGVEARTNIEISDIGNDGLSVADVTEVPKDLQSMAGHPILLSYKFLEPRYLLNLRVKKNADCSVLLSICEEAHFITTISFSGKNIHQMILSIKNTQQQFLRVHVPFQYEVWSTMMDANPIKPSFGEGFLMVPLLKPGNTNTDAPVKIEIVLLEKDCDPLSIKKGKLEFIIPKLDLPLRAAFYTVYLPESFSCSNFVGNLKNVRYFSATPPAPYSANANTNNNNNIIPMARARNTRHYSNSYDDDDDDYSDGGYGKEMMSSFKVSKASNSMMSKGKRRAGVIPVKIEMPTTRNQMLFEQILVDKDLSVSFDYKVKEVKPRRV